MNRITNYFKGVKDPELKPPPVKFISMKIYDDDIYEKLNQYRIETPEDLYATISEVKSKRDTSLPDPAEINQGQENLLEEKDSDDSFPDPPESNQGVEDFPEAKDSDNDSFPDPPEFNQGVEDFPEAKDSDNDSFPDPPESNQGVEDFPEAKDSDDSFPDPPKINQGLEVIFEVDEYAHYSVPNPPKALEVPEVREDCETGYFPDPPEVQKPKSNSIPLDYLKLVQMNYDYASLMSVRSDRSWSNKAIHDVSGDRGSYDARETARRLSSKIDHGTTLWISAKDSGLDYSRHQTSNLKPPTTNYPKRDEWSNRFQFILSCVGLSAGIGNVWRFPFLAYSNGGAAFLFAYIILLFLVGKPLYFMELAWGQFCKSGPVGAFDCCKLGQGIGYSMFVISLMVCVYYNVIVAYCIYYLFYSFLPVLPWDGCSQWWLKDNSTCYQRGTGLSRCKDILDILVFDNITEIIDTFDVSPNETLTNSKVTGWVFQNTNCTNATLHTPAQLFWERYVLDISEGIEYPGDFQIGVLICLVIAWVITFVCICKSIKTSGKVYYITSTLPYAIIIVLIVRGVTLDGAFKGLEYFFIPEWNKLLDIEVWHKAGEQLFFSLSVSMGSLFTYGSFNKSGKNIGRDAVLISYIDFATSILASIVIFSVLGNMSHELGIPIEKVTQQGQGLAFVAYPEAISRLWFPQVWSVMFFFMLLLLGLDSEFAMLEVVLNTIMDKIPRLRSQRFFLALLVCGMCLAGGLVCVLKNGQYVLNLWDTYGGGTSTIFTSFFEITCIMWGYGLTNFSNDLQKTMGSEPNWFWKICWVGVTPIVLLFICVWTAMDNQPFTYGNDYEYPYWGKIVGWGFVAASVGLIPIMAIRQLWRNRSNLRAALQPSENFEILRLGRYEDAKVGVPLYFFENGDSFDWETESNTGFASDENDSDDSFDRDVAPIAGVVGGRQSFVRRLSINEEESTQSLPTPPLVELSDVSESRVSI